MVENYPLADFFVKKVFRNQFRKADFCSNPHRMVSEIRSYSKGKMHGTWSTWNENGVKVGVVNYKKNLKHGEWLMYDDQGNLVSEEKME